MPAQPGIMREDGILAALSPFLFVLNLGITVVLLGLTIWAGRSHRRRTHYACAVMTLAALGGAIVQAELFGRDYDFPVLRLRVHLSFAFAALLSIPWVVYSGLRLRLKADARSGHQRAVASFVILTVLSILTAVWMLLAAEPIAV